MHLTLYHYSILKASLVAQLLKESLHAGDLDWIPGWEKSPVDGKANSLTDLAWGSMTIHPWGHKSRHDRVTLHSPVWGVVAAPKRAQSHPMSLCQRQRPRVPGCSQGNGRRGDIPVAILGPGHPREDTQGLEARTRRRKPPHRPRSGRRPRGSTPYPRPGGGPLGQSRTGGVNPMPKTRGGAVEE